MKINFGAIALLLLTLPFLVSCEKDEKPTLRDEIVGEWKIKSFTIDGVEVKGTVVKTSKIEFEAYTGTNGDFEWYVSYTDGTSETQVGDYTLDEADKEIVLQEDDGKVLKMDFDLNADDLTLEGIIDGERMILKAERD